MFRAMKKEEEVFITIKLSLVEGTNSSGIEAKKGKGCIGGTDGERGRENHTIRCAFTLPNVHQLLAELM